MHGEYNCLIFYLRINIVKRTFICIILNYEQKCSETNRDAKFKVIIYFKNPIQSDLNQQYEFLVCREIKLAPFGDVGNQIKHIKTHEETKDWCQNYVSSISKAFPTLLSK